MLDEDKAWHEYQKKFAKNYDLLNYSSSLQSFVMRASHKFAEKAFDENDYFDKVLEIGAGTGEHFSFVRHKFKEYILTDRDQKTLKIAKTKLANLGKEKLKFEMQVGDKLRYPNNTFARIIASHVLEHIYQPILALKEWSRVLKNNGILTILIPTDPGLAWRVGRYFGPRKNAVKQGIAYDYVMAREHVNSCNNLIAILRHLFPDAKEAWWPFPIPSVDLNLFFVYQATIKKRGIKT